MKKKYMPDACTPKTVVAEANKGPFSTYLYAVLQNKLSFCGVTLLQAILPRLIDTATASSQRVTVSKRSGVYRFREIANDLPGRVSLVILWMMLFTGFTAVAQRPFVTVWNTNNTQAGSSANNQIVIRAKGSFSYDWVDASSPSIAGSGSGGSGVNLVNFPKPGTYRVEIMPSGAAPFSGITASNDGLKLLEIVQWGDVQWSVMADAFYDCSNLTISATDVPNLSGVASTMAMFNGASSLTNIPNIHLWDVSNVIYMDWMFCEAGAFNGDLSKWDVKNVQSMVSMFRDASSFNSDLGDWDMSNVANMSGMFHGASSFNADISGWNVWRVSSMHGIFYNASAFNQNLGSWNLGNIYTAFDMFSNSGMDCENYSKTLIGWSTQFIAQSGSVYFGAHNLSYGPSAATARARLVASGWNITGDTYDPACEVTLPVSLVSFNVRKSENLVLLEWQTTSESDASHFDIERSTDAKAWQKIAEVAAEGESNNLVTYQSVDPLFSFLPLPPSAIYYRLKMVDQDGSYTHSKIVSVQPEGVFSQVVYPNPSAPQNLKLNYQGVKPELSMVDLTGGRIAIRVVEIAPGILRIEPLTTLQAGVYLLRATGGTNALSHKISITD